MPGLGVSAACQDIFLYGEEDCLPSPSDGRGEIRFLHASAWIARRRIEAYPHFKEIYGRRRHAFGWVAGLPALLALMRRSRRDVG